MSFDIEFVDNRHGWIIAENMVYYTETADRIVTGIENESDVPLTFNLSQNYPNPFNPTTMIEFSMPVSEVVTIEVFNIAGQKFKTMLNEKMHAGKYTLEFNAGNLASGVYFYKIQAGLFRDVKKMIVIK